MAKNTKGLTIAKTLLNTATEEEQHKWLDNEICEVCTIITDIKTIQLQSRIPLERLDKAFHLYVPPRTSVQPLQPKPQLPPLSTSYTSPVTAQKPPVETPNYRQEIATVAKLYTED